MNYSCFPANMFNDIKQRTFFTVSYLHVHDIVHQFKLSDNRMIVVQWGQLSLETRVFSVFVPLKARSTSKHIVL